MEEIERLRRIQTETNTYIYTDLQPETETASQPDRGERTERTENHILRGQESINL